MNCLCVVVYQLPSLVGSISHDPRSSHQKNPAWQFGIRHAKLFDDASPGPVHYPDVQYTRHGKNGMPHYSLYRYAMIQFRLVVGMEACTICVNWFQRDFLDCPLLVFDA